MFRLRNRSYLRCLPLALICIALLWPATSGGEAKNPDFGYPPYLQQMRAELRKMSSEKIMDLLRSPYPEGTLPDGPEVECRQHAFSILRQRGLTVAHIREIVERGLPSVDPRVIYSGLWHPVYPSSATAEEKAVTDELLKLLPPKLEQDRPWPSRVVRVMFSMAHHHNKTYDAAKDSGVWPETPYQNSEILSVLLQALVHPLSHVRQEAAGYLGNVGANEPDRAADVLRAVREQLDRETLVEYDDEQQKALVLSTMHHAMVKIIRDIDEYLARSGKLKDPKGWSEASAIPPSQVPLAPNEPSAPEQ